MKVTKLNRIFSALAAVISVLVILLSVRTQSFAYVDVGGHALRVLVEGTGTATVILENGLGPPLQVSGRVQAVLGKTATTVAYDRAGVAGSEDGPLPRDGRTIATELHTMLERLELSPPYILAGYSFGGLYMRTFTAMYPDEVAALVLIDPTRDDEFDVDTFEGSENAEFDAAPATMRQARESTIPDNVPVYLIVAMGPRDAPYPMADRDEYDRNRLDDLNAHTRWLNESALGHLIVTEDSGHSVVFEDPDLIVGTILRAIAETH